MTRKNVRADAEAFRVWQEGHSVDWQCTVQEIADTTGLTRSKVARICESRGWSVESGVAEPVPIREVDVQLRRGSYECSAH